MGVEIGLHFSTSNKSSCVTHSTLFQFDLSFTWNTVLWVQRLQLFSDVLKFLPIHWLSSVVVTVPHSLTRLQINQSTSQLPDVRGSFLVIALVLPSNDPKTETVSQNALVCIGKTKNLHCYSTERHAFVTICDISNSSDGIVSTWVNKIKWDVNQPTNWIPTFVWALSIIYIVGWLVFSFNWYKFTYLCIYQVKWSCMICIKLKQNHCSPVSKHFD